jgi:uncharacterized protein YraI
MENNRRKSQFTPLTYILIAIALILIYLFLNSKSSPNDCKIATGQYMGVYAGPGINYDVMTYLGEGDRLTLSNGKTTDGYQWQEITTDKGIKGWAAENWQLICE